MACFSPAEFGDTRNSAGLFYSIKYLENKCVESKMNDEQVQSLMLMTSDPAIVIGLVAVVLLSFIFFMIFE